MKKIVIGLVFTCLSWFSWGQCEGPTFAIDDTICSEGQLSFDSINQNYASYYWDFNAEVPFDSIEVETVTGPNIGAAFGIETVYDSTIGWVSLVTDQNAKKLHRIYFADGLENDATGNDQVTTTGVTLGLLRNVKAHYENGEWTVFILSWNPDKVVRMNFGNSLANEPILTELLIDDFVAQNSFMELTENQDSLYLVISEYFETDLRVYSLGQDPTNTPTFVKEIDVTGSVGLQNVDFIERCGNLYGVTSSFNTGFHHVLEFGSSILNDPVITTQNGVNSQGNRSAYLEIVPDGSKFALAFTTFEGNFFMVDLDSAITNTVQEVKSYSNLPSFADLRTLNVVPYQGGFEIFTHKTSMQHISFIDTGSLSFETSTSSIPTSPVFLSEGLLTVALTVVDSLGATSTASKQVFVRGDVPTPVSLTVDDNMCLDFPNSFLAVPGSGLAIDSYAWSLDGASDQGDEDTTYQFTTEGMKLVQVDAFNTAGCRSSAFDTVYVFNAPEADFTLLNTTICTNSPLEFQNNSSHPADSLFLWEWNLGDLTLLTSKDAIHSYTTPDTYTVQLKASLTGCEDSTTLEVTAIAGAPLSFNAASHCFGESLVTENTSDTSALSSFYWLLGDGDTTTTFEPVHQYDSVGSYALSFNAVDTTGCEVQAAQQIDVHVIPEASFVAGLACEQNELALQDSSESFGDSLASWEWSLDQGGTIEQSSDQNATFILGDTTTSQVTLVITSEFSCSDTSIQAIEVSPLPQLAHSAFVGCKGDFIDFYNNSSDLAGIDSVRWVIASDTSYVDDVSVAYSGQDSIFFSLFVQSLTGCQDSIQDYFIPDLSSVIQFELPDTVCTNELVYIENSNPSFSTYTWDMDEGDLALTPEFENIGESLGLTNVSGMEVLEDEDGSLNVFMTALNTRDIHWVRYESSFADSPTLVGVLEDENNAFVYPFDMKLIEHDDSITLLVLDASAQSLNTLDLGIELSFTAERKEFLGDLGTANLAIDAATQGDKHYAFINSFTDNIYRRAVFDYGLDSLLSVDTIEVTNGNGVIDISLVQSCGLWYGYGISYWSRTVHELYFGTSLANDPIITDIATISHNPSNIEHVIDGENHYLILTTFQGHFYRVELGSDLEMIAPETIAYGTFGDTLAQTEAMKSIKVGSEYHNLVYSNGGFILHDISYAENNVAPQVVQSGVAHPEPFSYTSDGWHYVGLQATTSEGNIVNRSDSVFVRSDLATDVEVTLDTSLCLANTSSFSYVQTSAGTIESQLWRFGSGDSSTSQAPTYQYASPGNYEVQLIVENSLGCENRVDTSYSIYESPIAAIGVSASPYCTFDSIQLSNLSTQVVDSVITWNWNFGNGNDTSEFELAHTYGTDGSKEIVLEASIPGCTDTDTLSIEVVSGSDVDFSFSNLCFNDTTQLVDASTGLDMISFEWNFPNGSELIGDSVALVFDTVGSYDVELFVTNAEGCINSFTQTIVINPLPVAEFDTTLSCTNNSMQFYDRSVISQGSVTAWCWEVQDGAGVDTSSSRNPFFTLEESGNHPVQLIAKSALGCLDTIVGSIYTYQSPEANFNFTKACLFELSEFEDVSTDPSFEIEMHRWEIDNQVYTNGNPSHQFEVADTFEISLQVTSSLGCEDDTTMLLVTDSLPVPDFTSVNACAGTDVQLISTSSSSTDSIVTTFWVVEGHGVENGDTANVVFDTPGENFVRLDVTTLNGCKESITRDVTINTPPVSDFIVNATYAEPPFQLVTTNSSVGASSYSWYINDSLVSSNENLDSMITETDDYQVRLVAMNDDGCFSTSTDDFSVGDFMIDVSLDNLTIVEGSSGQELFVRLENASLLPIDTFTLAMEINGEVQLTTVVPETLSASTVYDAYQVNLTLGIDIDYMCMTIVLDSSKYLEIDSTNNESCYEVVNGYEVSIFPTVTQDEVIVSGFLDSGSSITFSIFTAQGKLVTEYALTADEGAAFEEVIDLRSLLPGMYYIKLSGDGETQTVEVTKI